MSKTMPNIRLSIFEIFLLESVVWFGIWLTDEYIATLLTLIVGAIVFSVLTIALIAEWLDRSRVPRRYFWVMGVSVLSTIFSAALYAVVMGGWVDYLGK